MSGVNDARQPDYDLRENYAKSDADPLQGHEIDRGAENRGHGDLRRRNALEIEQRIAERRREKCHLHVDHEDDAIPERHVIRLHAGDTENSVPSEALHDRQKDRHGEQQNADPVEKHAEHEQYHHHQHQNAIGRQTCAEYGFGDERLAAFHDEETDEYCGAEEDPHDHGGGLQRRDGRLLDRQPVQPAVQRGDEKGAECADAGSLHRRGDADEDDAEHEKDEQNRRYRFAQEAELFTPIDTLFRRQRRAELRIDVAADGDVGDIKSRKQQAWKDRTDQQFAERLLRHDGVDDRHYRGRNENPECAARKQRTAGELLVIAAFEHGR